jgi:phytoene synthase
VDPEAGRLPPDQLAADAWQVCEALTRTHGKTFFLASRFLPPARRLGIYATYAFCRTADDLVDAAPLSGLDAAAAALDRWELELSSAVDPIGRAFAITRTRFAVPVQPAYDLIAGIRMDLAPRTYANWDELRQYCYLVAGTVGLLVAPVLGCRDSRALPLAAELGIAMQLTNILRDVGEDARAGRLYLPLEDITAFGCDPEAILAGRPGARFPELMAFQIQRARGLYERARQGHGALPPRSRFTTLAAGELYGRILHEIEAGGYDVFRTRARVSTRRKAFALPGLALELLRSSFTPGRFQLDDGASFSMREE